MARYNATVESSAALAADTGFAWLRPIAGVGCRLRRITVGNQCGSSDYRPSWEEDMPKITVHGGATNAAADEAGEGVEPVGDGLAMVVEVTASAEVVPGPQRLAHQAGRCGSGCEICAYEREHGDRS